MNTCKLINIHIYVYIFFRLTETLFYTFYKIMVNMIGSARIKSVNETDNQTCRLKPISDTRLFDERCYSIPKHCNIQAHVANMRFCPKSENVLENVCVVEQGKIFFL